MGTCLSTPATAAPAATLSGQAGHAASKGLTADGKSGLWQPGPLATYSSSSGMSRDSNCSEDARAAVQQQGSNKDGQLEAAAAVQQQQQQQQVAGQAAARALDLLKRVHELQQQLALVSGGPLLGLPNAADLICDQMGADLVALWVVSSDDPTCSVLLATSGDDAAAELERRVTHRPGGGPVGQRGAVLGCGCDLVLADAASPQEVPRDVAALSQRSGLRSFAQVPIGPPSAPLGCLLIAKAAPGGFVAGGEWEVWAHAASMGLLQHVRDAQVQQIVNLLRAMHGHDSPTALIGVLLRGAARYIQKATGVRLAVRLALLQKSGADALLFELPRADSLTGAAPGASAGAGGGSVGGRVTVSQIGLAGTLLASAIVERKARFVKDCSRYMQSCFKMATDIFSRSSDLVASIVVVPLLVEGRALGGMYFALDSPCSFEDMQDALLGLVHAVTNTLATELADRIDELTTETAARRARGSSSGLLLSSGSCAQGLADGGALSSGSLSSGSAAGPILRQPSSIVSASGASHRLNTEAMLQVLQQEVRKNWRRGSEMRYLRELTLAECIGQGGFGAVYRGTWHKATAAIKVMQARKNEHEAMKDAVEMAVLSSVQHPNIVTVYSCLTDMVEMTDVEASLSGSGAMDCLRLRFRRLQPDEETDDSVATCNLLVMEFCDRGTLREAVRAGRFHRAIHGGAIGVDILAAIEVLLDVAYAMQYLHSLQLVHGDIKMDNVLLKSDPSRPRGVTYKLADFGLTKILNESESAINLDGAGTVTHLAPEMFEAGSRVTRAVDAYAFGIFMYELYARRAAHYGLQHPMIIDRVVNHGARPAFPAGSPRAYAALAEECWRAEPAARPTFAQIAERLEALAAAIAAPAAAPAPTLAATAAALGVATMAAAPRA